MRLGSMLGLAVLLIAVLVVLPDVLKSARASTSSPPPHPVDPYANDPVVQSLQAQVTNLNAVIPPLVGAVASTAGKSAGQGVVSVEAGAVKGAREAEKVTNEDILAAVKNSQRAAAGAGETAGAQGAALGGAIGSLVPSLFAGIQSGIVSAVDASRSLPGGPQNVYEVPIAGGVYRLQDWIGGAR